MWRIACFDKHFVFRFVDESRKLLPMNPHEFPEDVFYEGTDWYEAGPDAPVATEHADRAARSGPGALPLRRTVLEEVRAQALEVGIRHTFPAAGSAYQGGESDGYCYRTVFAGSSLAHTYDMVRQFLREEDYGHLPLPADLVELQAFQYKVRRSQILLFEDNGYVHNPIKILFPNNRKGNKQLILEVYNEAAPGHLLRFHRRE